MYGAISADEGAGNHDPLSEQPSTIRRSSRSNMIWGGAAALAITALLLVVWTNTSTPTSPGSASLSSTGTEREKFEDFKSAFNKQYPNTKEEELRFSAFQTSLRRIEELNAENNGVTYAVNQYSDLFVEEFRERILSLGTFDKAAALAALPGEVPDWSASDCQACKRFPEFVKYTYENIPENFDWRDYGAVTGVKNQAECGSCWSFSTTGDVEGSWFLADNDLVSLSEQQLVACDSWINAGCDGGWPEVAFMYTEKAGGLVSEADYPYKKVNMYTDTVRSPNCDTDIVQKKNYVAHIDYWQKVSSSGSEEYKMALALVKSGPLSVALNANGMEYYSSGVDNPKKCSDSDIDHAVLLVGYGVDNGVKYWTLKNSWASTWGEDGYYRLIRGLNKCGIAEYVVHSVVNHTETGLSS